LYCIIPHFAASLVQRDRPELANQPLVLVGPEGRVFDTTAEVEGSGVVAGMPARTAQVLCPEGHLLEMDPAPCRAELESLFQVLEEHSAGVEPHGWGAAYADLDDLARDSTAAVELLREIGRAVRKEIGAALQPALGWDKSKFTAQAAARHTRPGRLRAVAGAQERAFLNPLPVELLPLASDVQQRLRFLGLRTLGQYAALPAGAVWQQFGRAGKLAQRCARGEDDRPVIPRGQVPHLSATLELEAPLLERERLLAALKHLATPLLSELRADLQACGQARLAVQFEDGSTQERVRTFLLPVTQEERAMPALEQLLDGMHWTAGAMILAVKLEQIQEAVIEQKTLFPLEDEREGRLRAVERYLTIRFGANRLRHAVLDRPGAPLPEWRAGWLPEEAT
jgi:nucleotidyltransferase/DNA polymerase involved in DNA repair